jgi:pterin-4a-carbinolamine dehydratase
VVVEWANAERHGDPYRGATAVEDGSAADVYDSMALGCPSTKRHFRFRNFREALTFVREVGELAETEGHHPDISLGWGNATVSLQTKNIKGLHENDFIMATKIDRIFTHSTMT